MGDVGDVFNALREEKKARRNERMDEADRRRGEVSQLLPPPYVLQRPARGVYQIRRGTGRVVIQWWPSKRKWWETGGPIHRGDVDAFKEYMGKRTWL